jgi:hypothetical protein
MISVFFRGVNKSSHFWDITQGTLVVADVSGLPVGSIFKGRAVLSPVPSPRNSWRRDR